MKKELEKIVNGKRSVVISGNTLSGKTRDVMFPIVDEIIKKEESLFITDSRKEYLNKYYQELKDKGYKVIVLDLLHPTFGEGFNPYTLIKDYFDRGLTDNGLFLLQSLHNTVFYNVNSSDPFWEYAAGDLASAIALSLIKYGDKKYLNFDSVAKTFSECGNKYKDSTYGIEYLKSIKDKDVQNFAKVAINAPTETRAGILAVGSQLFGLYTNFEGINNILSKSTFEFEDLKEKVAVFVELPKSSSYLFNIVIILLNQITSYLDEEEGSFKMNYLLDNFDLFDNKQRVDNFINFNDYRKAKFYIVTRSADAISKYIDTDVNTLANVIRVKESSIGFVYSEDERIDVDFKQTDHILYDKVILNELPKNEVHIFDVKEIFKNNKEEEIIDNIDKKFDELEEEIK